VGEADGSAGTTAVAGTWGLAWNPPLAINTETFRNNPFTLDPDMPVNTSLWLLATDKRIGAEDYAKLTPWLSLARISGLVLASGRGLEAPKGDLPAAWTWHDYNKLDQSAVVDLSSEGVSSVLDLIARGKPNVFLAMRRAELDLMSKAGEPAELGTRLRQIALLRQATSGMQYQRGAVAGWKPEAAELYRFSSGSMEAVVIVSAKDKSASLALPESLAAWRIASLGSDGALVLSELGGRIELEGEMAVLLRDSRWEP
jgi:hypothetical protein